MRQNSRSVLWHSVYHVPDFHLRVSLISHLPKLVNLGNIFTQTENTPAHYLNWDTDVLTSARICSLSIKESQVYPLTDFVNKRLLVFHKKRKSRISRLINHQSMQVATVSWLVLLYLEVRFKLITKQLNRTFSPTSHNAVRRHWLGSPGAELQADRFVILNCLTFCVFHLGYFDADIICISRPIHHYCYKKKNEHLYRIRTE